MSKEHLVIGPPGTGKTTYLARQATLAADKVGPEAVMIASLTKAAAEEVAGRKTPLPFKCVGTLHAHAFRALDQPALAESTEGIKAWNEHATEEHADERGGGTAWQIGRGASLNLDYAPEQRTSGEGEVLLQAMGTLRAQEMPRDLWPPKVARFAVAWDDWKKKSGSVDFTDLIEMALEDVDRPVTEPRIMMLDEAQDLSALEMKLARKWGETCEQLVVVGDPDQCLYQWRGTDPAAMAAQDVASRTVLSQSYRIPAAVHDYAVGWIEQVEGRPPVDYAPRLVDPEDESKGHVEGEVVEDPGTWREPEGVVKRMLADVEEGKTVMALTSCGYMLDPMIAVLKRKGMPFWNPYRTTHGGWNPLRGAERLLAFLRPDVAVWEDEARFYTWTDVRKWAEPLKAKGIIARGSKDFLVSKAKTAAEMEKSQMHPDYVEPEVKLAELASILFDEDILDRVFERDVEWWFENLLADAHKSARYPVTVYRERGGLALREEPKIILGTIHSVKGGEADSVYVFPDLSHKGWVANWDNPATRASTRRLFYVAFTRAREKLSLCSRVSGESAVFPAPKSNGK